MNWNRIIRILLCMAHLSSGRSQLGYSCRQQSTRCSLSWQLCSWRGFHRQRMTSSFCQLKIENKKRKVSRLEKKLFSKLHGLKLTMSSPRPELGFAKRALPLMLPYPVLEKGIPHIRLFRCKRLTWGLGRQHCRLSICEYWLSWTNTVSEAKVQITLLILNGDPV